MKRLNDLPRTANEMLGGLEAGSALKHRILNQAAGKTAPVRRIRWVPALAGVCALVLAVTLGITALPKGQPDAANLQLNDQFTSLTAGQEQANGSPQVRAMLDLPPGSIQLTAGHSTPAYRSIWAPQNGGNFPLIGVKGRYYRLLNNPTSISSSLLGENLGEITEFTDEPSLAGANQLVSNTVDLGEPVYAVAGMNNAMVAAKVDGKLRVFQRVTYAGSATLGKETLADTLPISGRVIAMELSGVGTITDSASASRLADLLLNNAQPKNAGASSGSQSLLIQLNNGLTLQMVVKNGVLSGCGGWTCPEFFDAFEQAAK